MSESRSFGCTNDVQSYIIPVTGFYFIECFGAQGCGKHISNHQDHGLGGRGGYAAGTILFEKKQQIFVYVGCTGNYSITGLAKGGFNGGGCAFSTTSSEPTGGGGGASDIRLRGGSWDDEKGLLSRIIVAGGGGGAGEDAGQNGGYGGGISGGPNSSGSYGIGGVFGKGAHTNFQGGGGGGGWFGGGTANGSQIIPTSGSEEDSNGGAGGSGYIYNSTSTLVSGYLVKKRYQVTNSTLKADVNEGDGLVTITLTKEVVIFRVKNTCNKRSSFGSLFVILSFSNIIY